MRRKYYQSKHYLPHRNHINQYDINTQRSIADEFGVIYESDFDLADALTMQLPYDYWDTHGFRGEL